MPGNPGRIAENGHLIFPADINETDVGETTFAFKTLVWNGVNALAAFTSQAEKEKGPESAAVSQFIDTMLDALMQMDDIEGLIINPWGEAMFLDKDDITVILNPGIERFI